MNNALTPAEIAEICSRERCNIVRAFVIRADGSQGEPVVVKNSRVNAGASSVASLLGSAAGVPFKYIALSTTALTPAATDTTLSGETSAAGLARAAATYGSYTAPASLNATATYVLSNTFTNTSGSAVTLNSIGCFNAASAGTMLCETNLAAAQTLQNNDSIAISWTFTL